MEKKLYYVIDDGDSTATMELSGCMAWIQGAMDGCSVSDTPSEDLPVFTISPVWMTQEEFDNLPESD